MNYQLSESEHRSLELIRDQLALVSGLLTMADAELGVITSTSLFAFLDERSTDLNRVIKAVLEREALEIDLERKRGSLVFVDWVHALRIARGEIARTPNGAEQRITERLTNAAKIDSDMKMALDEWLATLATSVAKKVPAVASKTVPINRPGQRRKRHSSVTSA